MKLVDLGLGGHGLVATLVVAWLGSAAAVPGQVGAGDPCDSSQAPRSSVAADSVDVRPAVVPPLHHLYSPPRLAMAGVTDNVLVEFVVDTTGVVDRCTIRILSAKRPEFAASAIQYVRNLRFTPGLLQGMPVRTRMQQDILFWQTNGARGRHHIF
jgi:TonB family protein